MARHLHTDMRDRCVQLVLSGCKTGRGRSVRSTDGQDCAFRHFFTDYGIALDRMAPRATVDSGFSCECNRWRRRDPPDFPAGSVSRF